MPQKFTCQNNIIQSNGTCQAMNLTILQVKSCEHDNVIIHHLVTYLRTPIIILDIWGYVISIQNIQLSIRHGNCPWLIYSHGVKGCILVDICWLFWFLFTFVFAQNPFFLILVTTPTFCYYSSTLSTTKLKKWILSPFSLAEETIFLIKMIKIKAEPISQSEQSSHF